MPEEYDIIIIGGGHNGLVCGAYLAKAGEKVLVLEKRANIGGGACTEEVTLPGFKHNLHSAGHSWIFGGPVYKDLELDKYGSKYIFVDPNSGIVFKDGRSLLCYRDLERTCKEIEKFSIRDAKVYKEVALRYQGLKDIVFASWFSPPLPPSQAFAPLEGAPGGLDLIKSMMASPKRVCDELFESDEFKTYILTMVYIASAPIDAHGMGGFLPIILSTFHSLPYGISIGGSRMLAEAIARFIESHGGVIRKGVGVKRIVVKNGEAKGVELEDGSVIMAKKAIASNTNVVDTLLKLVGEEHLDEDVVQKVKNVLPDELVLICPHLALNEALRWKAAEKNPDVQKCYFIAVGLESVSDIQDQINDIRNKIPPRKPGGVALSPTPFDPSQAPAGKHTALFWQFAPYELKEGSWDDIKEEYADRILDVWKEYVPNLTKDNILARYVYSPLDIERNMPSMYKSSMHHGDICQEQMGYLRPIPGYSQYRMPIKNLYLCGSSAHPAGGITGAPGYNCAGIIAEDYKIKRWWPKLSIGG